MNKSKEDGVKYSWQVNAREYKETKAWEKAWGKACAFSDHKSHYREKLPKVWFLKNSRNGNNIMRLKEMNGKKREVTAAFIPF